MAVYSSSPVPVAPRSSQRDNVTTNSLNPPIDGGRNLADPIALFTMDYEEYNVMVSELTPSVPDSVGLGKRKKVASSKKLASSPRRCGKRAATAAARPSPRGRAIVAAGAIVASIEKFLLTKS